MEFAFEFWSEFTMTADQLKLPEKQIKSAEIGDRSDTLSIILSMVTTKEVGYK